MFYICNTVGKYKIQKHKFMKNFTNQLYVTDIAILSLLFALTNKNFIFQQQIIIILPELLEIRMASSVNLAGTSVSLLRTWFNFLPGMAYRCSNDHEWTMQIVSAGSQELTGYSPIEFIERRITFEELILPEYRQMIWDTIQAAILDRSNFMIEYKIKDRAGNVKWVWEKGTGIYDENGSLLFLEGYITDISDRKAREEDLDTFFDIQPELVCIASREGIFLKLNRAWEKKFGYSLDELTGESFTKLVHPDDLHKTVDLDNITPDGVIPSFRNRYVARDGKVVHLEWSAALKDGKYYASARDITERIEAINRLEETTKGLSALNDQKNKFISILAHDLRGPFHPLLSALELLDLDYDQLSEEERRHFIRSGRDTALQLFDLLESILTWSRVSQGMGKINLEPVDVVSLINVAIIQVSSLCEGKGISVSPPGVRECYAIADTEMFVTVMRNLITNSAKFSDPGTTIDINVFAGNQVNIVVSDQGRGIEPDKLGKIFELTGSKSTPGTSNEPGSGMGILLCKEMVNRMNGKIFFQSQVGVGTIVTISLPKA